jgi:PAS domain S-box-containing protein
MNLRSLLTPADVLAQVQLAVIVVDDGGSLLYANPCAEALFGFPDDAEKLTGRSLATLVSDGGDAGRIKDLVAQVAQGRTWEGGFATQRVDGSRTFVRAHAKQLRPAPGEASGIAIVAREVTLRVQQRGGDQIRLLEHIGERLSQSLELDVTLRHVAQTLVPQFADHCVIDLFQGDKLTRRAQMHARDWTPPPDTWAMVGEQIIYPEGHFCQQAMSRRETVVVADVDELMEMPAPNAASLETGKGVGMVSVLAAPLVARGQLLGVMSLALSGLTERQEPHYGAEDGDFLGAISSRVAIAIDNAMLFEEERRTALAFQHSLLPHEAPEVDGLEIAYKYVPAKPLETHGQGIQTQVGGDWYDIIPLSAGRVGIVIGDVVGRGARAAAIMGQLRAALRAFAQDDKPPAEILRRLDDWCRTLAPADTEGGTAADPPIVSCTYLVYDAWSRILSFANAGHDAPLLITGNDVGQMEIEHKGVLLGVRGKGIPGLPTYREEVRYLAPGSALMLYTDGLTDRRQRADGDGHYTEAEAMELLCQAVRQAAGGTVAAIAQAAEEAVPGEIDDDMAIVVIRTSAKDLCSVERSFPADPIRVSEARRLAGQTFGCWDMDPAQAELACLLVSEVVTNVVLHAAVESSRRQGTARGDFTLRLRRGVATVWVEVFDRDLRLPRIRSAGESDEGGRGLYLVDQLATRWGSRPTQDGKAVWFEIPTHAEGQA